MRPSGPFHAKADDPCTSQPRRRPSGVLAGVRVADFSRVLAGPYATMTLADFGADVIKVEPPTGDDTRHWKPPVDAAGEATYFGSVNRNKRSVALDLTTEAGLAEARRLAASADVVVENFRPGVMERFGLSDADLRAVNPGLVYCSITGFGPDAHARRVRPARAGRRRPHVDHGRARRRAVQGRSRPRRRALRAERRRRDPARPARARSHRPRPAGRGEPPPEPALRADEPGGVDPRHRPFASAPRQPAPEHRAVRRVPGRRSRPRHRGRQRPAVPRAHVGPRHPRHRRRSSLRDERDARRAPRPPARRTRGGPRRPRRRALGGGALRRRGARGPRERRGRGDRVRGVARPRSGGRARCEPHRRRTRSRSRAPPPTTASRRRASTSTPAPTGFPTSEKGPTA